MKSFRSLSQVTAGVLALALAYVFTAVNVQAAAQPGPEQGKATVKHISGRAATYTEVGGAPMELKKGMPLKAGTTIQTGPGTSVYLDLGENGEALTIKPDSTLSIDKLLLNRTGADTVADTELEVKKGSIVGNVKKLSAASNYSVKTAKGVAGIRGSGFHIYAIGIYRCSDGMLRVVITELSQPGQPAAKPVTFTVTPGTGIDLSAGAPLSTIVVIPLPPGLLQALLRDVSEAVTPPGAPIVEVLVVTQQPIDPEAVLQALTNPPPESP